MTLLRPEEQYTAWWCTDWRAKAVVV